ncbi:F0F1 ATP synthase subunit A [Rhodopila globiformis]|uniref:ATP synthase subunit a n=1 Tax=Rhodopila globiformis TaxID=1071 RepID=A0A2S6NJ04_RHOGL|nr:F0F1 ATP synthase subunit A [Rhodopila globiformis]PPQ34627.1 F0F1 ATP synthase subunit A [Rhodopila globiformis]
MAAGSGSIDALGQFQLHPTLGFIGSSVNFTQSNLMMVVAGLLVLALLWLGMRPRAMVPGRLQAAAELSYDFVLSMCVDQIGPEGRKFFPFVFTLFFFILFGNLLGVFPYFFTFTSHIVVTLALTLVVFFLSTGVAIRIHGLHFLSYFVPQGVPKALIPLLFVIEVISYLSRIISLSVRLFANMMAGHVMLEVFGAFTIMLGGLGLLGYMSAGLTLGLNTLLIGFELLVATLQAYVFAVLTCIYLHDAVHLH